MHHRVIMVLPALVSAPAEVRVEAQTRFEQIAEALDGIRPDNAFWSSVRTSRLCLVVRRPACAGPEGQRARASCTSATSIAPLTRAAGAARTWQRLAGLTVRLRPDHDETRAFP